MIKLALTGSIGMGKSATAAMFAARGVPVYDADAAVHAAYAPGGEAVAPIEAEFPGVTNAQGGIDRTILRQRVVDATAAMKRLEAIVHPIVGGLQRAFLEKAAADGHAILARQVPDSVKRGRADFVIDTSQGFAHAEQRVDEILAELRARAAGGQDKTG